MNRGNRPTDYLACRFISMHLARSRTKMAHFLSLISSLPGFARPRRLALLAVLAAAALPSTADARAGSYDGVWNVTFATTRGNCSSGYSVPFTVTGSRVSSAGGGRVSGRVKRSGAVAVQVSVGASHASGGGRLAAVAGAGSWSGVISGDQCSGTWQARRT
jgi:hypothetical protein